MKWTNVSRLLFVWKHAIIKKLTTMVRSVYKRLHADRETGC